MARIARVVVPGLPHHITQRGNHQEDVFFRDLDRSMYLGLLAEYGRKYHLRLAGYCLMSNHVHLLVIPEREGSLAKAIGRTHNDYSRWLNVQQQRKGHVWQNRYYSCVMDSLHSREALRYVELNPVRAGLTKVAWDWPWSSALAHTTGSDSTGLLDMTWSEQWYSPAMWQEVLQLGVYDAALAARFREATRTGRPFADVGFVEWLEKSLGRALRPQKPGPAPRPRANGAQLSLGVA